VCEDPSVARRSEKPSGAAGDGHKRPVSLKDLAAHLGLSPGTISLVLNESLGSELIPQETKDRVFAAARHLDYRPNFLARSLRSKRSYAIGVMVPELSDGYSALVVAGIGEGLLDKGYMYLATSHEHSVRQIDLLSRRLWERCVEGLIVVDTPQEIKVPLPVVSVSGHGSFEGVTNLVLNHDLAADLGIGHLKALGHRRIAVVKGQAFSSDTDTRWDAIERAARLQGVPIDPALVVQLEGNSPSPETGYLAARQLMERNAPFTALFAFNDVSAFGAIRALQERGLSVPEAVSVIGFDDVREAAFHIPALTTIRQPLRGMGLQAATTLLERIAQRDAPDYPRVIEVSPELIVRESTGPAPFEAQMVGAAKDNRAAK
jgi:LacI family transcriptional regulator